MNKSQVQEYHKLVRRALTLAMFALCCALAVMLFITLSPVLVSMMSSSVFAVLAWIMVGVAVATIILCIVAAHHKIASVRLMREINCTRNI